MRNAMQNRVDRRAQDTRTLGIKWPGSATVRGSSIATRRQAQCAACRAGSILVTSIWTWILGEPEVPMDLSPQQITTTTTITTT